MTQDLSDLKRRMTAMILVSTGLALVAVGFAIADFIYGVKWALWGFVGFLVVGFVAQLWFIRGVVRTNKGN